MTVVSLADRAEDKAAWLAARRTVVTASDLVHLMDAADKHWRKSPEELAAQKRSSGELSSVVAKCGAWWESHILQYLDAVVGLETEPESRLLQDPDFPFLACSPDAWVGTGEGWAIPGPGTGLEDVLHLYTEEDILYGEDAVERLQDVLAAAPEMDLDEAISLDIYKTYWPPVSPGNYSARSAAKVYVGPRALVEVKNQRSKKRSLWTKPGRPPRYYEVQCQAQMAVIPVDTVLLTARVDADELHVHIVRRDELQIDLVREVARDFYDEFLKEA